MRLPSYFFVIFMLTFFTHSLNAVGYLLPSALPAFGIGSMEIGVIVSAYYIGATAARPIGGFMVERWGVRRTVLAAGLGGAVCSLALLSHSFLILTLTRFCVGVSYSVLYVSYTAYQSLRVPEADRGRIFGYLTLGSMVPQFVFLPVSEFILDAGALRVFMLLPTVLLTAAALYSFRLSEDERTASGKRMEDEEWGSWHELFASPGAAAVTFSIFFVALSACACVQYVPNLMRVYSLRGSYFIWGMSSVSIVLRLTVCGRIMSDYNRRTVFCFFATLEALALVWAAASGNVAGFLGAAVLFGIGHGIDFPAVTALLPDVYPARLLPKGTVLYLLANDAAPIILPLMIGLFAARFSLAQILGAVGVLTCAAFPVLYFTLWGRPPLR